MEGTGRKWTLKQKLKPSSLGRGQTGHDLQMQKKSLGKEEAQEQQKYSFLFMTIKFVWLGENKSGDTLKVALNR